jgi:hypothetical protein
MTQLEKLILYIRVKRQNRFVDGTNLHKDILIHMPRLDTFSFYVSTEIQIDDSVRRLSGDDVQETFTNIGYHHTACTANYYCKSKGICHVFSLPFVFDRLEKINNKFPTMIFNNVTYLMVCDAIPFKHEFFIRIAKAFPVLKYLSIMNIMSPLSSFGRYKADNTQSYSIIEYPTLTKLDIKFVNNYYIEQFLLDTKTHAPHLTEIEVFYRQLRTVTKNFTRAATRHNCANVKRLIFEKPTEYPRELFLYFPSL